MGDFTFESVASRAGVKLRQTMEREDLYRIVLELRKEARKEGRPRCNQTIGKMQTDQKIAIRIFSGWLNGKDKPLGSARLFDAILRMGWPM